MASPGVGRLDRPRRAFPKDQKRMKIGQLLNRGAVLHCGLDPNLDVSSLTYDSRRVQRGSLFFALRGVSADGNDFFPEALRQGALGVVSDQAPPSDLAHLWIHVENARRSLALAARNFYGNPQGRLQLIGVTGTNGKTTTCYLVESILQAAGRSTGLLGTVEYRLGNLRMESTHTTPESLELNVFLADLVGQGGEAAVVEVSSHALAQDRVYGCRFAAAVFTNLSQDHLDYHRSMESYFAAKRKLFEDNGAGAPGLGVLNLDDSHGRELASAFKAPKITYGMDRLADVRPASWGSTLDGLDATLGTPSGAIALRSSLAGEHNLFNVMAAVATAIGLGVEVDAIVEGVTRVSSVPGRFERIEAGQPFGVVVDYAHTDDALQKLILSARKLNPQRIITLFGCGGGRDRGKRPSMGETAGRWSDVAILTSDNPRTEDPLRIMNDVLVGLQKSGGEYRMEQDRRKAIHLALEEAQPGDLVLITGKGHETRQILNERVIEFDDREVCRSILADLEYGNPVRPEARLSD